MMPDIGDFRAPAGAPAGYLESGEPVWAGPAAIWATWTVNGSDGGGYQSDEGFGSGWSDDKAVTGWRPDRSAHVHADGRPVAIYLRIESQEYWQDRLDRGAAAEAAREADDRAYRVRVDADRATAAARYAALDAAARNRHGWGYTQLTRRQREEIAAVVDAPPAPQQRPASPFAALAALRGRGNA